MEDLFLWEGRASGGGAAGLYLVVAAYHPVAAALSFFVCTPELVSFPAYFLFLDATDAAPVFEDIRRS